MSLPGGVRQARRVGGGDINEAWHVELADGTQAFVKTRPDVAPGEYVLEAAALRWLAEPDALDVPRVIEATDTRLVLEWVEPGRLSAQGAEQLGRGLASVHAAGAPGFGDPGFARRLGVEARIGSLRLPNEPCEDWPSFYAQRRLLPLTRLLGERAALSRSGLAAVERVCERLPGLAGPAEPPARLHGDLWGGNVLADAHGRPWLIDPSAYGGHREVDLAMLQLFSLPAPLMQRVFDAYQEATPLAEGWQERVALWQLLPLLVHAALFGGHYCHAAEQVALHYAG